MGREGATLKVKSSNVALKLHQDSFELCSSELGGKRRRGTWEPPSRLRTRESAGPEEQFDYIGQGILLHWDRSHSWNGSWQEDTNVSQG